MMTLASAVDLVLFAFEHGNNGDIFVQKHQQPLLKCWPRLLLVY